MKVMIRNFLILALVLLSFLSYSQVTNSNITGTIKGASESLSGATIKATHLPTGTVFNTASLKQGVFNIVNMIPGGPYRIEVSYIGYQTITQDSIFLALGENTRLDISLSAAGSTLENVVVTGSSTAKKKTGASTNIGRQQIVTLPTLSRSIADFTRLTPQAAPQTGGGTSFGGANNRYNNITIDGAVNNDVFGLAASGTPGARPVHKPSPWMPSRKSRWYWPLTTLRSETLPVAASTL